MCVSSELGLVEPLAAVKELEASQIVLPLLLHVSIQETSLQHSTEALVRYGLVASFRGPKDDAMISTRIFTLVERNRKAAAVYAEVCVHACCDAPTRHHPLPLPLIGPLSRSHLDPLSIHVRAPTLQYVAPMNDDAISIPPRTTHGR